jgi:hypothetical protein
MKTHPEGRTYVYLSWLDTGVAAFQSLLVEWVQSICMQAEGKDVISESVEGFVQLVTG